jgi:hypothetical protein
LLEIDAKKEQCAMNRRILELLRSFTLKQQAAFLEKVLGWSADGKKAWQAFAAFCLQPQVQSMLDNTSSVLVAWKDYWLQNQHLFQMPMSFAPNGNRMESFDASWLHAQLVTIGEFAECFDLWSYLLQVPLFEKLRVYPEWKRQDFLDFVKEWGSKKEIALYPLLEHFGGVVIVQSNSHATVFLKKWLAMGNLLGDTITACEGLVVRYNSIVELRGIKLSRWVASMPPAERRDFHWYVACSSKRPEIEELARLVDIFIKKVIAGRGMGRDEVFMHWKGVKTFTAKDANLLSGKIGDVTRLLDEYLIAEEYRRDDSLKATTLIKAMRRRGLDEDIEKEYENAKNTLEKAGIDGQYYQNRIEIVEGYRDLVFERPEMMKRAWFDESLQLIDEGYLFRKLQYSCYTLNHARVTGNEYRFGIRPFILRHLEAQSELPIIIRAYLLAYKMVVDPNHVEAFKDLQKLLWAEPNSLSSEILKELWDFSGNFCTVRINLGDSTYEEEIQEHFEKAIGKGILLESGAINGKLLRNMIFMAIRKKQLPRARSLFDLYASKLSVSSDLVTAIFLEGVIEYYEGIVGGSISKLQQARQKAKDPYIKLGAWGYLWRAYFENGDFESILSLNDTLRMQIVHLRERWYDIFDPYDRFRYMAFKMATMRSNSLLPGSQLTHMECSELRRELQRKEEEGQVNYIDWILKQL